MIVDINITTGSNCSNCLLDILDNSIYLDENSTALKVNEFKKSETSTLTLLYLHKLNDCVVLNVSYGSNISIDFDGYFTVYYLILPTKEWIYNSPKSLVSLYLLKYFINDNKVYIHDDEGDFVVNDLESLIEYIESPNISTTIQHIKKEYVSICFLQKCYVNLCKLIFESRTFSQCSNKNNIDDQLTYKRDLVWMALNVIKYLVECNQLYEAGRIIELLNSCNGVCGDSKTGGSNNGCGCS